MIIENFEVYGLAGSRSFQANFEDDVNILTGKNGSGKTTILKLLWYVVSGNIEHAVREIPFNKFILQTNIYRISIIKRGQKVDTITFEAEDEEVDITDEIDEDGDVFRTAIQTANDTVKNFGRSVFFPTFRRIEGGFSLATVPGPRAYPSRPGVRSGGPLEEALVELSRRLSVGGHIFVSSISTVDIVGLLMRQYTEVAEQSNALQQETSLKIIEKIKEYKQDNTTVNLPGDPGAIQDANAVIDNIRNMIESLDRKREEKLAPLNAVRVLVEKLFRHAGIVLNSRISFGDAANAVNSDLLSAGEKQMLSFICYNAFYRDSVFFIDEPELSLHVDWQRQLFPILQSQGTGNQFIIATHSPFIYSKYPDKEILLDINRGDEGWD